jgi:hypothetical protein
MFTICPHHSDFIATLEFLLKFIGGIGATIFFIIGLWRYKKDQDWKRIEFIANEMKAFNDDRIVQNVIHIIEYRSRNIELFFDNPDYNKRFVYVNRDLFIKALSYREPISNENVKEIITINEVAIRDHFDKFLSYFERFDHLIESHLVNKKELKPYLTYWIHFIGGKLEDNERQILYNFIKEYKYEGTIALFKKFKIHI